MRDQATLLRQLMTAEREYSFLKQLSTTPVVVVGSGKGGVGKSTVAVTMSVALAGLGKRVLLFEGDQNLGNLHVLLGVPSGKKLEKLLHGEADPEDLLISMQENLWLLPGESGLEELRRMGLLDRARLYHFLSSVFDQFDIVIVDASAGVDSAVEVCAVHASRLLTITVPEPAALTDAYALIKLVNLKVPDLRLDVLVNRCNSEREGSAAFHKLSTAAEKFLQCRLNYWGSLPEDASVSRAVRTPGSLLDKAYESNALRTLREMTQQYLVTEEDDVNDTVTPQTAMG